MYCSNRNCHDEIFIHPDNWMGLCKKHFEEMNYKKELQKTIFNWRPKK